MENVLWKINHINLVAKLLKNMSKICYSCKKEFDVHTKDELLKCTLEIIQGVKGLPNREKNSTCFSCKRELPMHTENELLECSLEIIKGVKGLDSNRDNKE